MIGQPDEASPLGPQCFFRKKSTMSSSRLCVPLRLQRGCWRRSCCCWCLVVGMVAVVAIVLSVAVGVAGGQSVRNMSVLPG